METQTNQLVTVEEKVTNEITTFTSKLFTLKTRDFLKGLWTTVLGQVFTVLLTSITAQKFFIDWRIMKFAAASAFLGYLAKNFFEPTKTVILVDPAIKGVPTEETKETVSIPKI